MTKPKYDFMEGATGVGIEQLLRDNKGNDVVLEATDNVEFKWWNEGDTVATQRAAVIMNPPSNRVRYVTTQATDLRAGRMHGLFIPDVAATGFKGPTEPQEYIIGSAGP